MAPLTEKFRGIGKGIRRYTRIRTNDFVPLLVFWPLWVIGLSFANFFAEESLFKDGMLLGSVGSAGYLFTLVAFVILGDKNKPAGISVRITTALAMGAAVIFTTHALGIRMDFSPEIGEPSLSSTHSDGSLVTRLFPLVGLVIAVLLVIVTLIANRVEHARDAAEKAQEATQKIQSEIDAKAELLTLTSHLLGRMQAAAHTSSDLSKEIEDAEDQDQNVTHALGLGISGLDQMARFFSSLHQWILEPNLISTKGVLDQKGILILILRNLSKPDTAENDIHALRQRLRIEHWQPATRLLENLQRSINTPFFASNLSSSDDLKTVSETLREVNGKLNPL
uniref:Uncharacterized protein n=1 Tax=Candidatus Kentrum sp. MB TaxID=2138164 RepID=A0A450XJ89_9GAMM|nr:MAG: hypothetical protein BECKMB1821G_GA0114241_103220 [Candidatus Kentron sp. MB]VFK29351.1 MAG: hypothetical protein BECKMB1821I_GA0114274_100944 [Candidatus Kentron sp. MB]VFK74759.1 MAG: hypothetical protein BECKMB1821H_GA0114242_100944 [Candidatus Kentron sp. MB]